MYLWLFQMMVMMWLITQHVENVTHEMTTNINDTNSDIVYDSEIDESNYLEKGESNLDYSTND